MSIEVTECCKVPVTHLVRGVIKTMICPACGKPCKVIREVQPYVHAKKVRNKK